MLRQTLALAMVCGLGCASEDAGRPPTGLETLGLVSVDPDIAVPGTRIEVVGQSFLDRPLGFSFLKLTGTFADRNIALELPATFDDFDRMHVDVDGGTVALLGSADGQFSGQVNVVVDYVPDGTRHLSPALSHSILFTSTLEPELDDVLDEGAVYVNDPISVTAKGLLLGGNEGTSFAVVEGCFTPTEGGDCIDVGSTEVEIVPESEFDRTHGAFAFSPDIAGILPGRFEGSVRIRNEFADGSDEESDDIDVAYDLIETTISKVGDGGSFGQYIDIEGGGFVGEGDGSVTLLQIEGEYFAEDGIGGVMVPPISIVPEFQDGRTLRYPVNEMDALGLALEAQGGVRRANGTFDGTISAIIQYGSDQLEGPATPVTFSIRPVRQVVWVKFAASYVESLRKFGLRALDRRIRDRVIEVMRRDYETINVEFREEEPEDYKHYAIIEIAGPDPNGLGLLGYDNTPGKDQNNERLYDRIGGVNALTQEDGYAGYGGVFIESIFTFSNDPPSGISAEVGNELFDKIFDPFRSDRGGTQVTSADEADGGIPVLTNGAGCPTSDRKLQAACAVWALGSLVGTTTSHELGHSLGLADPAGMRFHNLGDGPNRLMDKGGGRPFEERAELMGQGPSVFCDSAYNYLRNILPTSEQETDFERPFC